MVRGEEEEGSARRERYAGLAARWIQRAWRDDPLRAMGAGDGAVAGVERALRQRRRRKKLVRLATRGAAGSALALAAAGFVLVLRANHGSQALKGTASRGALAGERLSDSEQGRVSEQGRPSPLEAHALFVMDRSSRSWKLETGTRVSASETSFLQIASKDGTILALDPDSILTVVSLGTTRRFDLLRGAVHAQVSKLARGERFIIDTADAEVEVRGTAFRVETGVASMVCQRGAKGLGARRTLSSRVSVEEGIVSVTAGADEVRLHPGDTWPPPCARPSRAERVPSSTPTQLRAQNELFAAAVSARNAGETARALASFEQLIRDYPQSSLLEAAMAARMRLLAGVDPTRAAQAAASYLSRFPDGVARTEAAALRRSSGEP